MFFYAILHSQVRVSAGGDIIGLDYSCVDFIFNLYGVEERKQVFEKVLVCFNIAMELNK